MFLKKRIFLVASLIISISNFSSIAEANHRWNLLNGIDPNPSDFKEIEVGRAGYNFAGSLCNNFWCDWGLKAEDIGMPVNESAKRRRMNK